MSLKQDTSNQALRFQVQHVCASTRARVGKLTLKQRTSIGGHEVIVDTPVFMPVGTAGTMKGLLPEQVSHTGCRLMLSNTYHLLLRPGEKIMSLSSGLHTFMNWPHALLTDSGGFQMVSLSELTCVSEEGVRFTCPYDTNNHEKTIMLTPERAIQMQQRIGSNIIMQLDDVVDAKMAATNDAHGRFEEAVYRSVRWYDRCRETCSQNRQRSDVPQSLMPIIQGGLDAKLRQYSISQLISRLPPAIAIGGLSGGEAKESFISVVSDVTSQLPSSLARYLMGVGHALDMLLCVALGVDMFDCVFPTRTARFGYALVGFGKQMDINDNSMSDDYRPIDDACSCVACSNHTRAYIHQLMRSRATNACHLLSQHNINFQMRFMDKIRNAIKEGEFVAFIKLNLEYHFGHDKQLYPQWIKQALDELKLNF